MSVRKQLFILVSPASEHTWPWFPLVPVLLCLLMPCSLPSPIPALWEEEVVVLADTSISQLSLQAPGPWSALAPSPWLHAPFTCGKWTQTVLLQVWSGTWSVQTHLQREKGKHYRWTFRNFDISLVEGFGLLNLTRYLVGILYLLKFHFSFNKLFCFIFLYYLFFVADSCQCMAKPIQYCKVK